MTTYFVFFAFIIVIIFDTFESHIQSCSKWNPNGETVVGNELNDVESITIVGTDILYVVDRYNNQNRLQRYLSGSLVGHTLWQGFDSIVFIDENGTIYTASNDGKIKRWIENEQQSEEINCQCNQCSRVWFDSEEQSLYIVERYRSRVIKCNLNTNKTIIVAGTTDIDGSSNETLSYPYSLYINSKQDMYIADVNNHRIQKWTSNTATAGVTVAGQMKNTSLHQPYDVIVDQNNFMYIADTNNHRIIRWKEGESHGEVLCGISNKSGNSTLHLNRPKSLAFDFQGNLYVADVGNKRIQKFTIDNSACSSSQRTMSQRLHVSKSKLDKNMQLGLGYNPFKASPVCFTNKCQSTGFGLPIFKTKNIKMNCSITQNSNIDTQTIKSLHDLNEITKKFVIFDSKYANSSFSYAYSKGIHRAIDRIIKDNATLLFTSVNLPSTYYSIVESTFELADDFRFVIEHMPCCELNQTVEKYIRQFIIDYFGYTYIRKVQLGCNRQQNKFNMSTLHPSVTKIEISSITDILTNQYFPLDLHIYQKAELIQSIIDRYLTNSIYCYDQCTDKAHGTCVDSGYFQFGICKCESGWSGYNCAIPVPHYINTFYNSSIVPLWNTRAGRNSNLKISSNETVSHVFDRNIRTSYGFSSTNISSIRSGLNTGFYASMNATVCIVTGFRFTTAIDQPKQDPIAITLEGSNADKFSLKFGKSWTLIYNGSSGLDIDPGRGKTGSLQRFHNSQFYRSYRMLVVSKRDSDHGVHYSEFEFYGHSCLPLNRNTKSKVISSTNAHMIITNDYPVSLTATISNNINMKNTFSSQIIEAGKTSSLSYISTGSENTQSYFDIGYGSNTIKVNIGQGDYVTNAKIFGRENQTGALLAPTNDSEYILYFFAGPGILSPLINSLLVANIPSIVAYVSHHPVHYNLNKDAKIIIKQLDLTPQSIYCTYAAYQQLHINLILNLNGNISGLIVYHGMELNFNFSLSNSSMLLQISSYTVTKLAFSIGNFKINDDLISLVQVFFSSWYTLFDTPEHLATTLNVQYNSIIVDKLNVALNKLLNGTWLKEIFGKKLASARHSLYDENREMMHAKIDHSRWMSNPRIQSKTLSQIKIPGTHNSGSYALTRKLSQIRYDEIRFLWGLSPDSAPANGNLSFSKNKLYVGRTLLDYIIDTTLRISISQNRTIRQQLDDGIRFFDLRVYYDSDGSFYIQHSLRGPEFNEILTQIRQYLDDHSTSGELIFLSISHTNFGNDAERLPSRVATIIQNNLRPYLYIPTDAIGKKHFDFQNFHNMTLSSITSTDSNVTSPKVIIINTDITDKYYYKDTVVNTKGFVDSGRWDIDANGVNNLKELVQLESEGLKKNMKSMYHISWIQTPKLADIIQNLGHHLSGNSPTMLLKQLAFEANSVFEDFLKNHTMHTFNLVTLDWYDISSTTNPVNLIIGLN